MPSAASAAPSVSLVVPTYKEAESLPLLLDRLAALRASTGLDLELLIMDDNSRDGTEELIAARNLPWVKLVVRTTDRGLSPSVVDGFGRAGKEVVIVMDADLSHPPERIPDLLQELAKGSEFVIGSRYVPGASTDEAWGVFRWLNSKVATLMARPFTTLNDPMSGFFAFRRELLGRSDPLQAIGYKIGLEVLVKSKVTKASEVPIHFAQRQKGESKLSFKEQLRYIRHLGRLFDYKYPRSAATARVLADSVIGLVVTFGALLLFRALAVDQINAALVGAVTPTRWKKGIAYQVGVLLGAIANISAARAFALHRPELGIWSALAVGAAAGAVVRIVVELFRIPSRSRAENRS
jgi:dolichol-phosphate mannosyltransferase